MKIQNKDQFIKFIEANGWDSIGNADRWWFNKSLSIWVRFVKGLIFIDIDITGYFICHSDLDQIVEFMLRNIPGLSFDCFEGE